MEDIGSAFELKPFCSRHWFRATLTIRICPNGAPIKRFLMQNYGMAGANLVTVGYGKSKLKDPSRPLAEVNRRVQVVNMENKTTAAK